MPNTNFIDEYERSLSAAKTAWVRVLIIAWVRVLDGSTNTQKDYFFRELECSTQTHLWIGEKIQRVLPQSTDVKGALRRYSSLILSEWSCGLPRSTGDSYDIDLVPSWVAESVPKSKKATCTCAVAKQMGWFLLLSSIMPSIWERPKNSYWVNWFQYNVTPILSCLFSWDLQPVRA
jgi:hypothetical protein